MEGYIQSDPRCVGVNSTNRNNTVNVVNWQKSEVFTKFIIRQEIDEMMTYAKVKQGYREISGDEQKEKEFWEKVENSKILFAKPQHKKSRVPGDVLWKSQKDLADDELWEKRGLVVPRRTSVALSINKSGNAAVMRRCLVESEINDNGERMEEAEMYDQIVSKDQMDIIETIQYNQNSNLMEEEPEMISIDCSQLVLVEYKLEEKIEVFEREMEDDIQHMQEEQITTENKDQTCLKLFNVVNKAVKMCWGCSKENRPKVFSVLQKLESEVIKQKQGQIQSEVSDIYEQMEVLIHKAYVKDNIYGVNTSF
ncbi:hypothetical protein EIN_083640 [Entamoeba invadens IP1]|uniref:hypothetical protein n=1 Tax=Entamoeba invadens IP1 TaxID=370355 RepID=UPI0002C3D40D|nr:hypothetical protein EIN_083640 [Entamoeba invadens IP1]ELP85222.1 hypothetical protein EIN_083640 [Entamoeba invadens IP1]|eukprot:XP_004184568.1 hypothetical protein EIN_083640 [Entamoeba invadens IP1]